MKGIIAYYKGGSLPYLDLKLIILEIIVELIIKICLDRGIGFSSLEL